MKDSSDLRENPPGNRILHLSFRDEAPSTPHRHTSSLHPGVWEQCGSGNGISLITLLALPVVGSRKRERKEKPQLIKEEKEEKDLVADQLLVPVEYLDFHYWKMNFH